MPVLPAVASTTVPPGGNTGIGLAHVCNARGYRLVIVMPDNQSPEKYALIEALGAEVRRIKAVPYADPNHYQKVAARLAGELPNAILANQFDNVANRRAHVESTGPEIWQQTDGRIDAFVASSGTGGTLAGVSKFLREKKKDIVIGLADPHGAGMYNLFKHGEAKATEGNSITEGIGLGRMTPIIEELRVDKPYLVPDEEAITILFELLLHEGLCLGGSSGINVAGAIRLAKDLGPGHTIVTVLCDSGTRYQSKLYNPEFLHSKKLPVPEWLERKSNIKPPFS